ncbi:MAG: ParB/RepB/Spo0J family partition protein [Nitrososphaeraceae archaeon]|nr:ParB/RepB/Spo0J family partition protein [Nitrososphaeraceae archaeon]
MGLIEEIDLYKINEPSITFYGNERSANDELIASIKQHGLLQPIIVRTKENFFEVVSGRRRYNACKSLGLRKIICHIVELDDKAAFEISLIENIQRKNLDPIEEANAFKAYVDDFGWGGITDLASKISKSSAYVCKRLSLLNLPTHLLTCIQSHTLGVSAAEELISVKDPVEADRIADIVVYNAYTSRQTRSLVRASLNSNTETTAKSSFQDSFHNHESIVDIDLKAQRSFDKSITALKVAMNRIAAIINSVEDNWVVYETLLQHKNMLNSQIDIMIREKKRLH